MNRPRVLLLDEPLGALDLKLREQMQVELKAIQRDVGITFVFVTHDQEEALTMSDRVAVFNRGRIEQVGSPREVYERPATAFVAGFVGTSNLLGTAASSALLGVAAPVQRAAGDGSRSPAEGAGVPARRGHRGRHRARGGRTRARPPGSWSALDAGGELVALLPPGEPDDADGADGEVGRGDRVRLAWRSVDAYRLPGSPASPPGPGTSRTYPPDGGSGRHPGGDMRARTGPARAGRRCWRWPR